MKVIDILNKIANGEDVPKKIRIHKRNDSIYEWRAIPFTNLYHYFNVNTGERLGANWRLDGRILIEEVEIIEEDKEIEHYDMFDYFTGYSFDNTSKDLLIHLESNFKHINEELDYLIKTVNELKKEGK